MERIKTYAEFINETWGIGPKYVKPTPTKDDEYNLENLHQYLLNTYEEMGDKNIEFNKGKDANGIWWELTIPVTMNGQVIQTEPGEPGRVFSIDFQPELEKYVEPGTYDDIDDSILDEHGWLRALMVDDVTNTEIIKFLEGLLKNVPDPALRKRD